MSGEKPSVAFAAAADEFFLCWWLLGLGRKQFHLSPREFVRLADGYGPERMANAMELVGAQVRHRPGIVG